MPAAPAPSSCAAWPAASARRMAPSKTAPGTATSAAPARAGVQPGEFPPHPRAARSGQALVADHAARSSGQARREDRPAWSLDRLPDGRGDGAACAVPALLRRHRGVAAGGATPMFSRAGVGVDPCAAGGRGAFAWPPEEHPWTRSGVLWRTSPGWRRRPAQFSRFRVARSAAVRCIAVRQAASGSQPGKIGIEFVNETFARNSPTIW